MIITGVGSGAEGLDISLLLKALLFL